MSVTFPDELADRTAEWLSIREFAQAHPQISPWLVGELVRRNQIDHVRIGRRVLIPRDALDRLAARQWKSRTGLMS